MTLDQQSPELWAEIGQQAREVQKIERFLLSGRPQNIISGHKYVNIALWTYNGEGLLVALNTDRKSPYEIRAQLPNVEKEQLLTMFTERPFGLTIENGHLIGTIKPEDVHVYSLKMADHR